MQKNTNDIVVLLIIASALIVALAAFIVIILYLYRKKQILFLQNLEQTKLDHEKNLLAAQLEMQESTFQHVSREIHDNISLSLTLAKLHLNTLNWDDNEKSIGKVNGAIELLSESINDLNDISKGLNADFIIQQGLLNALDQEIQHICQIGLFAINSKVTGNPVYMDSKKELIIFRIVQEAFNNIIKHAHAHQAELNLHFNTERLYIAVSDDGDGFDTSLTQAKRHAGLMNMETRIKMLHGTMHISSVLSRGTTLTFTIPLNNNGK
jgi:two-component system, NarL family, sensor kinase